MKVDNCWANIDKKEGSLNSKVNVHFDENDTGVNRSVKIRVSSRDGSVSEECTVVHKKKEQVVYRNKRQSALFTKEGCNPETEKGEELEYVVEAGKYTSIISQSDADDKAMRDIEQNGQNWVNEHGRCITILWYSVKKSKSFRKNDCDPDTEEGSLVTMTIEAGQFSSTISQEDADRKAEAELNAKGQDYANSHGTCNTIKWYNDRKSKMFQKTDCEVTEVGSMVEYVVEAGRFSSSVSKEDANQKALDALEAEGPGYANEHGRCITILWYSVKKSKSFRKNDCDPDTEEGSLVTMTIEAGQFSSTISQEDADRKAEAELNAKGQDYANSHGTCNTIKWYNDRKSKMFQKTDCEVTEVGSMVEYVVEAGRFSSSVSKEDANQKALDALEAEGPGYANEHGTCETNLWYNVEKSKVFYKNDCEDGFIGAPYTYTVEAGKYTSDVSQEDADQKALDDIEKNGQEQANLNGECVTDPNYFVGKASARVQKNDCDAESQTGSFVDLTEKDLAGYPDAFVSRESQEAANALAEAAMEEQKQDLANKKGTCIDKNQFVGVYSKVFTKDNCEGEGAGSQVTVDQDDVTGGPFTSYESQEAANALAQAAVEQQGQAIANRDGHCTWTGKYSEEFTKNDCNEGQTGSKITVTEQDVVGAPFTSTVSQDDANNKAKTAVKEQGQAIANRKGNCENMTVYAGHYSKKFVPECEACHKGVEMEVTAEMVNGSPVTSTESQEAADAEARRIVEEGGQAYVNKNGNCTPLSTDPVWEDVVPEELRCNEGKSQKKQRDTNECSETHNQERWVDGGNKVCSWTGHYTETFQKNDCEIPDSGTEVEVSEADVEGNPFISFVSQEDADNKAKEAVKAQGQNIANQKGKCRFVGVYSKEFTKDNCGSCQHGVPMSVTQDMVGGPFYSNESQEEANRLAQEAVEAKGQAYVNKNGTCETDNTDPVWEDVVPEELRCNEGKSQKKQRDTNECSETHNQERWVDGGNKVCSWTGHYTETFQKNDCEIPDSGTEVEVSEADVEGNPFISFVSQEDADNKAKEAVKAQGQNIANQKGKCRFVGVYSKEFTKDNCGSCQHGVPMSVTQDMVGGPFYSNESQEEANRLAQEAVEAKGQAYVNKNGTCETDNTDPVWEDSEPLETKCEGGKSYKKQVNTNECYGGENERWVEGGDKVCTWTGTYSKVFTKQCADGGVGSEVTIDQDDVTGGPFTSTVSQEDANSKAQAAVEQQGQALADAQGTCTWTGKASKVFTKNNCGSCQHGSSVTVTQDQVGGPFTSNISQADANKKAQDAVNSQGQAVANKNGDCVADSTTPSWSDTGSTRCDGCTSQKQQRDTNPCSSSYNDTRWVNGGGESCTDWSYYGTGDCVGHTQYYAYRDSCSGSIDRQYSVSCRNCCNCGSYGSWRENGCKNDQVKYVRYDDCGNADYKYEYEVGKCGYAPYEFQFHDGRTSKSRSVSGESQDIKEVIISTKSGSYIGFSVKSKPDWCSVDYRDQTSESMKAVVTLSANTTSSSRSGDIVFVQNESGKTITLSISQARQMLYKFTFDDNTTSDKSLSVQAASNDAQYTIKSTLNGSYHGFSTTSKPSWITTEYKNQASDSMVCVLKITANTSTSSSRTGSVVLTQNDSGKTLKINVTQAAAEVKLVPAHITLKNGSWATYKKSNVSYNPGAGKCIAGFEWTGDENGDIRIYTCDIKVVDSSYREIPGATISVGTIIQRKWPGSSCSYFGAVAGGILAGYAHVGDENKDTTWYIRTINVSYDGKLYKSAIVRQFEKTGISKNGGIFNVYNESPASYNFIVDGAECGDERGTLKYSYSQMNLNPA